MELRKNLSVSEGMGRGISEYCGRKEGWEKRSEDEMDKTAKKRALAEPDSFHFLTANI